MNNSSEHYHRMSGDEQKVRIEDEDSDMIRSCIPEEDKNPSTYSLPCILLSTVIICVISFVFIDLLWLHSINDKFIPFMRDFMANHVVWGVLLFTAFYTLTTTLCIPGAFIIIPGGAILTMQFGLWKGFLITFGVVGLCDLIVGQFLYLIGRISLQNTVSSLCSKSELLSTLKTVVLAKSLRLMILIRLSGLIPFSILNLFFGGIKVPFKEYAIALPASLFSNGCLVYIGCAAGATSASSKDNESAVIVKWAGTAIGIGAAVAAIILVTKYSKAAMDELIEEQKKENLLNSLIGSNETDLLIENGQSPDDQIVSEH